MTVPLSLLAVNQNGGVSASCFFFWANLCNYGGADGATRMYLCTAHNEPLCHEAACSASLCKFTYQRPHLCVYSTYSPSPGGVYVHRYDSYMWVWTGGMPVFHRSPRCPRGPLSSSSFNQRNERSQTASKEGGAQAACALMRADATSGQQQMTPVCVYYMGK